MGANSSSCLSSPVPHEAGLSHKDDVDSKLLLHNLSRHPSHFSRVSLLSPLGCTVLHTAAECKQVQVAKDLLSFLSSSDLATVREALLPYCRRMGVPVPGSVSEGVRTAVNMVNAKGQTPLMYACYANCPEMVKLLLSQGANPWLGDRCGSRTAVHYAALGGNAACVEALFKYMPPRYMERNGVRYINCRSVCGLTPLHYAVFYGHLETVREVLQHDPFLNAATTCESYDLWVTCDIGSTPLHFAAVKGNSEVARELLQHYLQREHTGQVADPRRRCDSARQLAWQVAAVHHPADREMVALLHPGRSVRQALGVVGNDSRAFRVGPAPLAVLAAEALRAKLLSDVDRAGAAAEAGAHVDSGKQGTGSGGQGAAGDCSFASSSCAASAKGSAALQPCGAREEQEQEEQGAWTEVSCQGSGASGSCGGGGSSACSADGGACTDAPASLSRCAAALPSSMGAVVTAEVEDDDEDSLCGVCLSEKREVAPSVCGHGLCVGCARELCKGVARKPLACPFCRQTVGAFVVATASVRH